jgi:hypothetical protein
MRSVVRTPRWAGMADWQPDAGPLHNLQQQVLPGRGSSRPSNRWMPSRKPAPPMSPTKRAKAGDCCPDLYDDRGVFGEEAVVKPIIEALKILSAV